MKKKISLHLAIISCLALVLCTCALTGVFYRIFFEQIKHDIRVNAELICTNDALRQTQDASSVQRLYGSLDNNNLRMTWIRADGRVLFDNDVDERSMANHLDRPEIQDALHKGQGESTRHSATSHFDTYYYAVCWTTEQLSAFPCMCRPLPTSFLPRYPLLEELSLLYSSFVCL